MCQMRVHVEHYYHQETSAILALETNEDVRSFYYLS